MRIDWRCTTCSKLPPPLLWSWSSSRAIFLCLNGIAVRSWKNTSLAQSDYGIRGYHNDTIQWCRQAIQQEIELNILLSRSDPLRISFLDRRRTRSPFIALSSSSPRCKQSGFMPLIPGWSAGLALSHLSECRGAIALQHVAPAEREALWSNSMLLPLSTAFDGRVNSNMACIEQHFCASPHWHRRNPHCIKLRPKVFAFYRHELDVC
jgi:hypothetical protein